MVCTGRESQKKEAMSIAKTLYERESFYDYNPIVNHFGNVVVRVDDDDYQGNTRVLYKNGDIYGLLLFGWGVVFWM